MTIGRGARICLTGILLFGLAGCGSFGGAGDSVRQAGNGAASDEIRRLNEGSTSAENVRSSTLGDLFANTDPPNTTIEVNKYIWNAAQQVLDFMPVEAADPFSGVLVYGYGLPPGGRTAYRATVYVQDPALDARSLNLSLQTRSGPAPADTVRAIEDAILARARQLRIRDSRL